MGPTAIGKTALAMAMHDRWPCQLISVDAMLVYQGLNIGTAKPTAEELIHYPHALIDLVPLTESFDVAAFLRLVMSTIEEAWAVGRCPVLVGGSMMYFHALRHGIAEMPSTDPRLRLALEAEGERLGWSAMWQKLRACDPVAAEKIKPHDRQRVIRALAVFESSGTPISEFWRVKRSVVPDATRWVQVALMPRGRDWLYRRIEARFDQMLDQGWVDEVAWAMQQAPHSPALRAVGYRQIVAYLQGNLSWPLMIEEGKKQTRRLAKRQCTGLRSWPELMVYHPDDPTANVDEWVEQMTNTLRGEH